MTNSTGELIPIPVIRKLVMGGSEKARLVPARVDGALAKWRRHYGEPKGLSGKSSFIIFPSLLSSRVLCNFFDDCNCLLIAVS